MIWNSCFEKFIYGSNFVQKFGLLEKTASLSFSCSFFRNKNILLGRQERKFSYSRFLTKISIFDQNFNFSPKFGFLTKISIFEQNFDLGPKFRFLTKSSIFDQNFNFYQNLNFWPKILFSIKETASLCFCHAIFSAIKTKIYKNRLLGRQERKCDKLLKKSIYISISVTFTNWHYFQNWKNIFMLDSCSRIFKKYAKSL